MREKKIIDKGSDQLDEDFNYKNVIDRIRLCQFETKQMQKEKLINYKNFKLKHKLVLGEIDVDMSRKLFVRNIKSDIEDSLMKRVYGHAIGKQMSKVYR